MHPKKILEQHEIAAKKSLGQNFLFDENVLARIVAAADLTGDDHVLEIGPGLGSLTRQLAETAGGVVAVELDDRLFPILQAELASYDNVTLVHEDILSLDPAEWFERPYKVVANVPYYITGAILRHLLTASHKPTLMVMTVQKEVAERITAVPPNMNLLAVSVQFYGRAQIVDTIKAGAFWPRPEVDSAVIRVELKEKPCSGTGDHPPINEERFFRLVKAGFAHKRKQLKSNLRNLGYKKAKIAEALEKAGIDGRRRAETLTIAEWTAVYRLLNGANTSKVSSTIAV